MSRRGISKVDGRLAHDGPAVFWLDCADCGSKQPASVMLRRVGEDGQRMTLCHGCYERATGGAWRETDEYWDGGGWVALRVGI